MFNKTKKIKKAFTLAEILISLTTLGIIISITALTTTRSSSIREKKVLAISQTFASNVESAMQQIVFFDSDSTDIRKNADGTARDVVGVRDKFVEYLDGDAMPCDDLTVSLDEEENVACASFPQNVVAIFEFNKDCNSQFNVKEYFEASPRAITNACGKITFGVEDIQTTSINSDFTFVLGFSKSRIK